MQFENQFDLLKHLKEEQRHKFIPKLSKIVDILYKYNSQMNSTIMYALTIDGFVSSFEIEHNFTYVQDIT